MIRDVENGAGASEPGAPSNTGTEAGTVVSVPFMLTAAHKRELRALGYTDEQIQGMTPEQGQDILAQRRNLAGVLAAWSTTIGIGAPRTVEQVIAAAEVADDDEAAQPQGRADSRGGTRSRR